MEGAARTDWIAWHAAYDDPDSSLALRLAVVQRLIAARLERRGAGTRIVSMCAGAGRDVLAALAERSDGADVHATLVEADPRLVAEARARARELGLANVRVAAADASRSDSYADAVPADLVLACGIFGNVSDDDVARTIRAAPQLCSGGAAVIWTRHRRVPDLTPSIRGWFADAGFSELAFESPGEGEYAVGMHELGRRGDPLVPGTRLFTFLR